MNDVKSELRSELGAAFTEQFGEKGVCLPFARQPGAEPWTFYCRLVEKCTDTGVRHPTFSDSPRKSRPDTQFRISRQGSSIGLYAPIQREFLGHVTGVAGPLIGRTMSLGAMLEHQFPHGLLASASDDMPFAGDEIRWFKISGSELNQLIETVVQIDFSQFKCEVRSETASATAVDDSISNILESGVGDFSGEVDDVILDLLTTIYGLDQQRDEDHAIDVIFERMNSLLVEGRFNVCDRILAEVDLAKIPPVLMVSLLTITAAARTKLKHRAQFFSHVQAALARQRGAKAANRLLAGLE